MVQRSRPILWSTFPVPSLLVEPSEEEKKDEGHGESPRQRSSLYTIGIVKNLSHLLQSSVTWTPDPSGDCLPSKVQTLRFITLIHTLTHREVPSVMYQWRRHRSGRTFCSGSNGAVWIRSTRESLPPLRSFDPDPSDPS